MKFKTLILIYTLLEKEKEERRSIYDKATENLHQAINEEKEDDVIEALDDLKMSCYRKYSAAIDALNDFENKEW